MWWENREPELAEELVGGGLAPGHLAEETFWDVICVMRFEAIISIETTMGQSK